MFGPWKAHASEPDRPSAPRGAPWWVTIAFQSATLGVMALAVVVTGDAVVVPPLSLVIVVAQATDARSLNHDHE